MSPSRQDLEALDPRVNRALQDFLERTDRGEAVDPEQFLAQHADIADHLRSFIDDSADLAQRAAIRPATEAEVSTNRSLSETIAPASPGAVPALPEVFGRYRVSRLLGRGAMGAVYLAQDTQLSRQVAIKVPSFGGEQSEELLQRFYREARSAATLRNPHICPVYDVGEIDGQHYISMAYIDGHPLSDVIKANGPQPERHVLLLVRKLALALQDAHNQGVIHRDLKPGNVMVDARGEPVVMDFGLACQLREGSERLTHSGVILGSPAYMSPEQLEGSSTKVTPASDQYALGVMLYELLTGVLPFRGSISAVISQIVTKPAPSPRLLRPELDPRVDELCLQMLSKTPSDRFASMKAVADRVLAILKEPAASKGAAPANEATSTGPTVETALPTGAGVQQQVAALVKRGELQSALEVLEPVAARKGGKLAEWARQQQTEVRAHVEHWQREVSTLCLLAGKLIRKHDYAEVSRLLSAVPAGVRTDELNDLLSDALEKEEESCLLLKDIEEAIRDDLPKELPRLVKRFLQLKPGNKAIQTLAADLQTYGPERVIRVRRGRRDFLDPAGQVWNPVHIAGFVGGLALVCTVVYFAAITFQTQNGTVIIEVHDPRVTVSFANDEITANSSGKKFRLKTTEKKTLQLEINGVTVDSSTQEISVTQNETKLISARLVDGKLDLSINSEKRTFAVPEKPNGRVEPISPPLAPSGAGDVKVGEWIDMLNPLDLTSIVNSNNRLTREDTHVRGTLRDTVSNGWVIFVPPTELKGDYDLELDYQVVGCAFIKVGLPLNDCAAGVSIGQGGTRLDGLVGPTRDDVLLPPLGNPDMPMKQSVIQHLTVSVRNHGENVSLETKLDGVETGRYSGPRSPFQKLTGPLTRLNNLKVASQFVSRTPDHRIEFHKARVRFVTPPIQSPTAAAEGWVELFNGKDLTGWTPMVSSGEGDDHRQEPGSGGWRLVDGRLICESRAAGWLRCDKLYRDFELELEYKLPANGNSGIRCRSTGVGFLPDSGFEIQIVDDARTEDAAWRSGAIHKLAGPPGPLGRPVGEWNQLRIRCEADRLQSYLNGRLAAEAVDARSQPGAGVLAIDNWKGEAVGCEFRNARIRELIAVRNEPAAQQIKADNPSRVILDVDFRKSDGGFGQGDQDHILAQHKDGEYRYLGKKPGWWYGGLHPALWRKENMQLRDFALEVDVRLVGQKQGDFAMTFGRSGDESLTLCLDQVGRLKLLRRVDEALVPPMSSPAMRPVDQFNTIRMEVEDKLLKVSANGQPVFEKKLERYAGAGVSLWLKPEDVPFDSRLQRFRLEQLNVASVPPLSQEVRRLKGHADLIRGVAFLPDGQRAMSVGHGQAFKLWDVTTGQLLHDFVGHTANVTSVSVSGDGLRALTGCDDGHVRLWDIEHRTLLKTLKWHTRPVVSVLLSRDGQTALSASNDGILRRWDLKTGGKSRLMAGPDATPTLAVSPDESVIAAANLDGSVYLRSTQGIAPLIGHSPGDIWAISFTPDGTKLVSGADDGTVRLWNLQDGKELHRFETDGVAFDSVAVTGDSRYAIAGCEDRTIVGWDLTTGDRVVNISADLPVTHRLALSPDNQYVLSGGGDDNWKPAGDYDLRLWKLPSPPAPPEPLDHAKLQSILDADFSKGNHGFTDTEDEYFKTGLLDGEWQYLGKQSGWGGWGGQQSLINSQAHHDFVFEAEMRWAAEKGYAWGLEFGRLPNENLQRFHMSRDRKVWLASCVNGDWHSTTPENVVPWMRAATEFNTVRLEVVKGHGRMFVNSRFVAEAPLHEYGTVTAALLLFPDDAQPDLRFRRIRLWHVD